MTEPPSDLWAGPTDAQGWAARISGLASQGRVNEALDAAETAAAACPADPALAGLRAELALAALGAAGHEPAGQGLEEGRKLQRAYDALVDAVGAGLADLPYAASYVFMRLAAHDWLDRMGGLGEMDRRLAERGEGASANMRMARVGLALEDRLELLRQRRLWGEARQAAADRSPVTRPPRPPGPKIRLGLISNDLRQTNVGVFAWPLFEHRDRDGFELFVYSAHTGPADPIQQIFEGWADGYRQLPGASPRAMAERIAADGLDVLIELGGPYGWEVCAYRPAPLQVSWLGYANSVGLPTIDHILLDPYLAPEDPALLLERQLAAPRCWIAMTEAYFEPKPELPAETPEARNGFVTFGTMNAAYKYSPACLALWARTVAAVPNSRFLFVRPEAGAQAFRDNVARAFAAHGVMADRLRFAPVRGGHMPYYNEIDIALDTLPLTGGTTTCETLWMGVPVVTLVGPAAFERVSYSILVNAGLADLAARTPQAFMDIAVALARDPARRTHLKRTLRAQIRANPLGQPEPFARDFYDLIRRVVETAR